MAHSLEAHRLPLVSATSDRRLLAVRLISPSGWRGLRLRSAPPVRRLAAVSALAAALLAVAACSTPQSSRSEQEADLGPFRFEALTEQVEGSVAFGEAADGPWQRRTGSLTITLEPAPRLARIDVLDRDGGTTAAAVFEDGETTVDLGATCGEQPCGAPVAYRITTDATGTTTLTGTATAAFESDDTSDLGEVEVDLDDIEAVALDPDEPVHAETRVDVQLAIDAETPIAGTFVTFPPEACGESVVAAAMATPPDSVPADNGGAQVVSADGTAHGLAHEGVSAVPLECDGGADADERSLWLTMAGGTEVGRTVRIVLFGAATDGAEVRTATVAEGGTATLDLSPDDERADARLVGPAIGPGVSSRLVFAQLGGFESYSGDLSAGPFDDGDSEGTVRMLVGPCPPADCLEPVPASLTWFGAPPEDAVPVSADFSLYALDAPAA